MDEATARRVLLVRAFDEAAGPLWTADDGAWATRLAAETVPAEAPPQRFLAERARHALERLLPREPAARRWLERRGWRPGWLAAALAVGAVVGLAADVLGRSAFVDVLAPPAWAVLAWNLAVYALLLIGLLRPAAGAGLVRRLVAAPWSRAVGRGPLNEASRRWAELAAPALRARAAAVLHLAAATVGAGVIAGMYLRGLVFDFRAGWQSTFLDAETVQRTLALLLAPASAVTGIALPDIAGIEALRLTPAAAQASATAAPWIHLYAATLGLGVVAPRLLLAAAALLRAAWLARHVALPLDDAYAQGLLRRRRGGVARVDVCPHAAAPSPQAALALRERFAREFGADVQVRIAEPVRLGDEEQAARALGAASPGLRVVLVDLSATPAAESQGRLIAALRAAEPGVALQLLADESGFARRFGTLPQRLAERRAAWQAFAQAQGVAFESAALEEGRA